MAVPVVPTVSIRWLALSLTFIALLSGCSHDSLFGDGIGADAEVSTPAGIQSGKVSVVYTLTHETVTSADVRVTYSTNGSTFFDATEAAEGSDGTSGLTVTEDGESHTFVWDSAQDLGDLRFGEVLVKISPKSGCSDQSASFEVHNAVFLAAAHPLSDASDDARVSLYDLDLSDGEVSFFGTIDSGGEDPQEVLFLNGYFFVANEGSNDVSVLKLDANAGTLTPVTGSPFDTNGLGPRHLATDGSRLFVSNVDGGTISVFDIVEGEEETTLDLNSSAAVGVPGCRDLVVRGSRVFIADNTNAQIVIYDIEDDELLLNANSPVAATGLTDPRAMTMMSSFLYVANETTTDLVVFRFLGGGGLLAITSSPFTITDTDIESLQGSDSEDRMYLAGGTASSSLGAFDVDGNGVPSELAASPISVGGPASTVLSVGEVVLVATSTGETVESFVRQTDGTLEANESSPFDLQRIISGMAVSD